MQFLLQRLRATPILAATTLLACNFSATLRAQLGSGWIPTNFNKSVHLDDTAGLQTFSWSSYRSVCSPICADYGYQSATDTETFRIFDSRSNRSEIRLQNNYSSGVWQFEGYVKFDAPLHDESLFQIFGNTGAAATFLMMRGYRDNGGTIRVMGGSNTIATGVYGEEVRINVIHQHNVSAKFYVNGNFIYEKPHNDPGVTNYWKYGVYGTTSGNVPAIVEWRAVRTFRDGLPPDASATPPGAFEAENALLNGPVIASNHAGYTGSGFADFVNDSADYVQWTVNTPTPGLYDLGFRYALQSGDRPLEIQVNGETINASLDFAPTGAWNSWSYATIPSLYLQPGDNTIRATAIGLGGPNLDYLLLSEGPAGDLNRDGAMTVDDWTMFKAGQGVSLAGMTLEEAHAHGDLNGDLAHDLRDFVIFREAYDGENGEEAFAQMLAAVPEPSALPLTALTLLSFAAHCPRRRPKASALSEPGQPRPRLKNGAHTLSDGEILIRHIHHC